MRLHPALMLPVAVAVGACSRGDNAGTSTTTIGLSEPDHFAQFLNPEAALGLSSSSAPSLGGDYIIVAATKNAAVSGSYTLTITYDNGTTSRVTGTWNNSGGQSATASGNPRHALEMPAPGGIVIDLVSSLDTYLYLVDLNGTVLAQDDNSGGGTNARISLPASSINSEAYAQAYYAMIDPLNERDTITKWKTKNGFDGGYTAHVVFQDIRDLGYGRNMYFRGSTAASGDVAAYVENFSVTAASSGYTGPSPLNLDAVVSNDRRWHIGTNAIEWSMGPGGARIAKFYNYSPDGTRNLMVDLDGRGPKAMPNACIYCHGGRADPLQKDASGNWVFPRKGNVWGRLQGLEVDALRFSTLSGFTRAEQEASFKTINQLVLCTYPYYSLAVPLPNNAEDVCRIAHTPGEWVGDSAAEMIKAWYGGVNPPPAAGLSNMPNATFDGSTYVPLYWQAGQIYFATPAPAGSDAIYQDVIAKSCRTCHILRGTINQYDIDFTAWETMLDATYGYGERIKTHVFSRGRMPLSLLVYNTFWENGTDAGTRPYQLAYALPVADQPALDSSSRPLKPGRPVANPGPNNRIVTTPLKLSAAASEFASSYQWSIISSPAGSSPVLSDANTMRPTFDTDLAHDGAYVLRLTVSNGTDTATKDITVNVQNTVAAWGTAPLPKNIRFAHIRNILQSPALTGVYGGTQGAACSVCHEPVFGTQPVFYTDYDRNGDTLVDGLDLHQFYLDIKARVDFADPEMSPLLRKPSKNHHGGGLVNGFGPNDAFNTSPDGYRYYNIFLEWILNGAPE